MPSALVARVLQYGDLTFQEAYDRTGRVLNVSVSAADTKEPPRVLNYLTAPHAVIWSSVAASSAFPFLFPATDILGKDVDGAFVKWGASLGHSLPPSSRRWRDGSLENDLPMKEIGVLFNVNWFIVSQTNPHISPILNIKALLRRVVGARCAASPCMIHQISAREWRGCATRPGGAKSCRPRPPDAFTERASATLPRHRPRPSARSIAEVAEAEVKHRFQQLTWLLPPGAAKVARLMSQPWEGDVTVVSPALSWTLTRLITDMSPKEMAAACRSGERSTWEKMPAIQVGRSGGSPGMQPGPHGVLVGR